MGSREELLTQGFTVARGILPLPLVARLLAACDVAKAIARRDIGPSAQRLQPVVWRDDIDQAAFEEYSSFAPMEEAVERLFSPRHRHCNTWHANAPCVSPLWRCAAELRTGPPAAGLCPRASGLTPLRR